MKWHRAFARRLLGASIAGALGFIAALGCDDEVPTRSHGFCWMTVDTLYASGIRTADTAGVRTAFEAYIAFVDSTPAEFPEDSDWVYVTSRPFHIWRERFYWQVDHEASCDCSTHRLLRRICYIDENGVVVLPFGCI